MENNEDIYIGRLGEELLLTGKKVSVPTWQALDVRDAPQGSTIELLNTTYSLRIPPSVEELQSFVGPNLPWAENHFQERISGQPLNPGETYKEWPWYHGNVETHKKVDEKFSHTYMERYWPDKEAEHLMKGGRRESKRWDTFGDLNDLIALLVREPTTRQAYLPVWFPFDTGAVHKERVPCSLGYLFLLRNGFLHITYYIRSCDYLRHFKDDVYLTCRLCQWVIEECLARDSDWATIAPGVLDMHIGSLHVFEGDLPKLRREHETRS